MNNYKMKKTNQNVIKTILYIKQMKALAQLNGIKGQLTIIENKIDVLEQRKQNAWREIEANICNHYHQSQKFIRQGQDTIIELQASRAALKSDLVLAEMNLKSVMYAKQAFKISAEK